MNELKLIVAGGRDFTNYIQLAQELHFLAEVTFKDQAISIVSGMARGADALGAKFARDNDIVLYEFPADWDQYGKGAGFKRNQQMADFSHALLAFWDGKSSGTAHMIETMRRQNKPVYISKY